MKRCAIPFISILVLLVAAGCAQTPQARFAQALVTYNSSLEGFIFLRKTGNLSDEDALIVETLRDAAALALEQAQRAVAVDDLPSAEIALDTFRKIVAKMEVFYNAKLEERMKNANR